MVLVYFYLKGSFFMKTGKLNWDDLNRIVEKNRGIKRKEVRIRSAVGEDCSIIKFGDFECVLSTDPITGASSNMGRLAVNVNCNDIASSGAEPLGILVTILAPPASTLDDIRNLMEEINEECEKLNIEVLGGHTEVTEAVNKLIVSCTVIGKNSLGSSVATSGAEEGDDIIVTKSLCIEGVSIIVNDYYDMIKDILTEKELNDVTMNMNQISVVKEGIIAHKYGVHSMHDITEGGILGALWEVAKASNKGFEVYENIMPVPEAARKICNKFEIDPLRLISSGSMLITTKGGEDLVKIFEKEGIKASVIGKITKNKGIIIKGDKAQEVLPPERDELFVLEKKLAR